ncbi:MAG TPA: HEAT repeat domain-containing protein [Acidimicrobiales bacterium]|jgi:HEAT repeat protein|nr:HEAT repeat domain-containing protein [Acidimicrobiales bacterium]
MKRGRRRDAAIAGHTGDEATARALLDDVDPAVRATAMGALARAGALRAVDVERALADADSSVRRRACEEAVAVAEVDLVPVLADTDPSVVEACAWALGERGAAAAGAVDALVRVAGGHADALCREAAVAALGAIGDRRGLDAVLTAAAGDRPAVRRRAVVALAAFDGPEVDAALHAALDDRDWQVRQAAEDLLD